ncbi:hypothetical protein M9434_005218 [Picochlorum sp. BPE23]|nr:hypothetical protein M9434_005218 [Picochlorum sp. BPE23]
MACIKRSWVALALVLIWVAECLSKTTTTDTSLHPLSRNTESGSPSSVLRVHIVPHTHDDSGWLKTFEQYYWGSKQYIQSAGVQYILDSVVDCLLKDERRRFTYAEMSFFMTWWRQQDEDTRDAVRDLVKQGRLDFVNGGYVQHDEAASHYVGMLDQTTRGHRFLKETFGFEPKIGWQIDPFGHSSTQAGLFGSELGFDGMFFGRADFEDMNIRKKNKELEFVWKGSGGGPKDCDHDEDDDGIFVGNFASGNYGPPAGFNFEFSISDPPIQDDPTMDSYNVPEKVLEFISRCEELAAVTSGDDIMFTMGSDFHYSAAHAWFKNLDKLIYYVNEYSKKNSSRKISVFYSTPHEYLTAKHEYKQAWPTKVDDFFPYSDAREAFWTGYFTSRSASKRYIRQATSFLQAARQLEIFNVFSQRGDETRVEKETDALEEAISLCQHHDSITGTEKQHVASDYHVRIHKGMQKAQQVVAQTLKGLVYRESAQNAMNFEFCDLLNSSICPQTVEYSSSDDGKFFVTVYNSLSSKRQVPVFIPISLDAHDSWEAIGPDGSNIPVDVLPLSKATEMLQKYHYGRSYKHQAVADAEVVFTASVPPLGFSLYLIQPSTAQNTAKGASNENFSISNDLLSVIFDAKTGYVKKIKEHGSESIPFFCTLSWYNSSDGLDSQVNRGQGSGAYIFRPNGKFPVNGEKPVDLEIIHGEQVSEARQIYSPWAAVTLRLYKGRRELEVEWTIGPLPDDSIGREVVIAYSSPTIKSNGEFWTDANGRSMIRRVMGQRIAWKSEYLEKSIAGNYYPVTSAAYITDDSSNTMSVITDRSQGASSLQDGELEFMLHRRTIVDDKRGVNEPLNEMHCPDSTDETCVGLVVRGKHWIHHSPVASAAAERRILQQEMNDEPVIAISRDDGTHLMTDMTRSLSFMPHSIGINFPLHILTLMWAPPVERNSEDKKRTIILRLAHSMDVPEGGITEVVDASQLAQLVQNMGCDIKDTLEVSLSTNQPRDDMKRLVFKSGETLGQNATCSHAFGQPLNHHQGSRTPIHQINQGLEKEDQDLHVHPMQIRTFEVYCHD